ncbi:MAG: glycosyltransferase family A protein [Sedimentisphaerales bacterium]
MATVNIIVPAYNRSKLLKECVESLLAQTYCDLEIHVVDDGSTDDTQETIGSIMSKHSRIKYSYRPHLGAPAARNFGLTKANGEFIGFFDSDDLWPPDYIETMVKSLQAKPDFDAAYSKIMLLVDGEIRGQYVAMSRFPSGNITADLFSGKPFVLPSSAIFRKNVWAGVFWDEALRNRQDFDIFLRISTRTKFMFVPEIYAMYRSTENGIGAVARRGQNSEDTRVMERFYFLLDGSSYVPKKPAFRNMSHRYRRAGLEHYKMGNRTASIAQFKKALSYQPLDLRLYVNLLRALLLNPRNDRMPDWKMPDVLGQPAKSI